MKRALVIAALIACGDNNEPKSLRTTVASFPDVQNPSLDVLFVIANNTDADQERALAASAPFAALQASLGALPNLHVGFATADLGTLGASSDVPAPSFGNCSGSGDDGRLVMPPPKSSTDDRFYLVDGAGSQNFDGTLDGAFANSVTTLGANGCGFTQDLASMQRVFANPANAGFRRDDANLAIVVLADRDDCSVSDPGFFTTDTSQLGPLEDFRCTRFGLTCDQDIDSLGTKTNCRPSTASPYISDVTPFVDAVRAQEPDPFHATAFAIVGDPTPVNVQDHNINGVDQLAVDASCTFSDQGGISAAGPGVRLAAWAEALGGSWTTACNQDYSTETTKLVSQLTQLVAGQPCITADVDATTCTADEVDDLTGARTAIPACTASTTTDCFSLAPSGRCPALASVARSTAGSAQSHVEVSCDLVTGSAGSAH